MDIYSNNGFNSGNPQLQPQWNNVTLTLYGVSAAPAPGALALLGLAGVCRNRSRRA